MEEKKINRCKAIRKFCLGCMGDSGTQVKVCTCVDCELWVYRFGTNPYSPKHKDNPYLNKDNL